MPKSPAAAGACTAHVRRWLLRPQYARYVLPPNAWRRRARASMCGMHGVQVAGWCTRARPRRSPSGWHSTAAAPGWTCQVSRPFASWNRSILTEIYLCHSWQDTLRTEAAVPAEPCLSSASCENPIEQAVRLLQSAGEGLGAADGDILSTRESAPLAAAAARRGGPGPVLDATVEISTPDGVTTQAAPRWLLLLLRDEPRRRPAWSIRLGLQLHRLGAHYLRTACVKHVMTRFILTTVLGVAWHGLAAPPPTNRALLTTCGLLFSMTLEAVWNPMLDVAAALRPTQVRGVS
jgi:hypothetical protein